MMLQDNFKNRYLIKIASSVVLAVLNAIIQFILPRAFSVKEYGYYSYNLNVFTSVVTMATLSAPSALVSKFSKRNEEIGLVRFYLKFYLLMAVILQAAILAMFRLDIWQGTFTGQTLLIVMLGLQAALVLRLHTDSIGIFDAMAISRYPALMQVILKVILSVAVIASYFLGRLNLAIFYILQIFITLTVAVRMLYALMHEQKRMYPKAIDYGFGYYLREYYSYCRPLILSSIISQAIIVFMNWALMNWAGAVQQAMFGAAWQLNSLVCYVFSPYAELSKREFAVIVNDKAGMRMRYGQALKIVTWMTCYFALFIGFEADWIIRGIYGNKYEGAAFVTLLVMYYTVYQSWGQIAGSFFMAVERTGVSAVIGVASQIFALACIFLFQIPNGIFPAGLGANGIALTHLLPNMIVAYLSLFIISRILEMSFLRNFSIQIVPVTLCSIAAYVIRWPVNSLIHGDSELHCMVKVLITGVVYSVVVFGTVYLRPGLVGITREAIHEMVVKVLYRRRS